MAARDAATEVAGVISADDDIMDQALTVIYDDQATDINSIQKHMKEKGFPSEGSPEFIH